MNTNIDELVFRGVEASFDAGLVAGLTLLGSYTWLDTEDANDVDNPVGEAFSNKQSATLRFDPAGQRFWAAGEVRRNGTQKDPGFAPGNPIGDVMPSFTVLNVRGGFVLSRDVFGMQHQLNVAVTNLTNTLYAEFSNAGFFRPEPKRNLTLSWTSTF
jgi:outer membrane receptor protein involved in Fe transport